MSQRAAPPAAPPPPKAATASPRAKAAIDRLAKAAVAHQNARTPSKTSSSPAAPTTPSAAKSANIPKAAAPRAPRAPSAPRQAAAAPARAPAAPPPPPPPVPLDPIEPLEDERSFAPIGKKASIGCAYGQTLPEDWVPKDEAEAQFYAYFGGLHDPCEPVDDLPFLFTDRAMPTMKP